jgi:hypothetical protein
MYRKMSLLLIVLFNIISAVVSVMLIYDNHLPESIILTFSTLLFDATMIEIDEVTVLSIMIMYILVLVFTAGIYIYINLKNVLEYMYSSIKSLTR